jgi:BASS family bile acid:Na+ symporter
MTQPLKNVRLVILALLANFGLVPLLAFATIKVIPLDQSLQIGVILLGTAAGAPFIPKLVQGAKGNVAYILLVIGLGLNLSNILSFIGTLGLVAMVLLILGSLVVGVVMLLLVLLPIAKFLGSRGEAGA